MQQTILIKTFTYLKIHCCEDNARVFDDILDWLRTLAAQKLGRANLNCKWSAFFSTQEYLFLMMWRCATQEVGFLLLPVPGR